MLKVISSMFFLTMLISCNKTTVTSSDTGGGSVISPSGDSDKTMAPGCAKIAVGTLFNSGSGTPEKPYYICSEQQFLNISAVKFNSALQITDPGYFDFPYMDKAFIIGANLSFPKSKVEFFSLGHLMASVGHSVMLSDDQKQTIANYDEINRSSFVASLTQMRIPFTGSLNGNGYSVEVGDYIPTESRLIGLFSLGGPGLKITNLTIKNFHMYSYGGVNAGLLFGSILETPVAKQWVAYSAPRSLKSILIDNVSVINSSLNDVVANSGSVIGAVRVYPDQEIRISNIKVDNVKIDGGLVTQLEAQYGDDLTNAIYNKMHNVGNFIGSLHSEGKAVVSNIKVNNSKVSLQDFYSGKGRVIDNSDINYIYSADLTDQTSYDINFIYDMLNVVDYDGSDPVWGVSNFIGSLASLSSAAKVSINDISVINSSSYFEQTAKGVGSLVGELAMLSGDLSFLNVNLKSNKIELNNYQYSARSWGIGNFAGYATFAGSGANYSFRNISVNGEITASFANYSSDISGFFGHLGTMDEIMTSDNTIVFSDIFINGSSSVFGNDIHSIAPFAGTFIGLGDQTGSSTGINKVSMSNIYNEFKVTTLGSDPLIVGGFIGFLGEGDYSINNVVVNADIQIFEPGNFYTNINSVIGLTSIVPAVADSYYVPLRSEFLTGLSDPSQDFGKLTDEAVLGFEAQLSKSLWGLSEDGGMPVLLVGTK